MVVSSLSNFGCWEGFLKMTLTFCLETFWLLMIASSSISFKCMGVSLWNCARCQVFYFWYPSCSWVMTCIFNCFLYIPLSSTSSSPLITFKQSRTIMAEWTNSTHRYASPPHPLFAIDHLSLYKSKLKWFFNKLKIKYIKNRQDLFEIYL